MAAPALRYRISVPQPRDHLAHVTLVVPTAGRTTPLEVAMPAWCPGSYLIRDYARFVRDLTATGASSTQVTVTVTVADEPPLSV